MRDVAERDLEGAELERLRDAARRETGGAVDDAIHARGRERFERAIEGADRARLPLSTRWHWLAVAAAFVLFAGAFAVLWPARLAFSVEGAVPSEGYVRAGAATATARFSDGTAIGFSPGARGRISEVTSRGARVNVEEGRVAFQVVHRPRAEWTAGAGPFSIRVTGTAFDVTWVAERLELELRTGSVIVRGPLIVDGLSLRAGQRLVADVHRGTVTVEALDAARAEPSKDAHAPPASPSSDVGRASPLASGAHDASPIARSGPSWRELVARGDFAVVLSEADARGMATSIEQTPLSELGPLADAARYAGRGDVARRAMLAERERFPGSPEARSAAFLLGRLDEPGSPSQAVAWYDRYLAESPGGPLAGEALGRKMLTVKRTSGAEAARPAAEAYLRRFPGGAFAPAAEEITGPR